jgi:inhibitor of KinA sporulation pathway (predicted exonuclease)
MKSKLISLNESNHFGLVAFLDCEYTCWENSERTSWVDPKYPQELIQFGLANLDVRGNGYIEKYSRYVCPRINPVLSGYCKDLLGITQDTIDSAEDFCTVAGEIFELL